MSEVVDNTELDTPTDNNETVDIDSILAENERLKKHAETLLAEKKAKQEQARQAQLEREKLEQEQLRKNGDFEQLEQTLKAQIERINQENEQLKKERERDLIERESHSIVAELTTDPKRQKLLKPFVEPQAVVRDGNVWYKDENGQPVLTKKEFAHIMRASSDFDVLVDGSRASGSGASGKAGNAGKSASDYTEAERAELAKNNPDLFKQLFLTR